MLHMQNMACTDMSVQRQPFRGADLGEMHRGHRLFDEGFSQCYDTRIYSASEMVYPIKYIS